MRVIDASQVKELVGWRDDWCVSVFLPSHEVAGKEGGDVLRLKNLLRDAQAELIALGMRRSVAENLLSGAAPEEIRDPGSAAFHRAGIAIFAAPGLARTYQLEHAAPELVTVARRFHLKPLLREMAHDRQFFLLALTRGSARLYYGTADGLRPIDVPGMPASLDDAVQYDERERAVQSHSASRRGVGGVVAAYHGQGDRDDHLPEDMLRYLRMVDASLNGVVEADTQLVLAGSKDTLAAYRTLATRGAVPEEAIFGNPDLMAQTELHARALAIVGRRSPAWKGDAAQFAQLHGTGKASDLPATVFTAARQGRVATIFAAADAQSWGRFDDDADAPDLRDARVPGDEDLIATAVMDAWTTGATVHVVSAHEVPGRGTAAAVFRY